MNRPVDIAEVSEPWAEARLKNGDVVRVKLVFSERRGGAGRQGRPNGRRRWRSCLLRENSGSVDDDSGGEKKELMPRRWPVMVLTFCNVGFLVSMVPSLFVEQKPSLWSSVPTAALLSLVTMAYAALGCAWPARTSAPVAVVWWALAAQVVAKAIL